MLRLCHLGPHLPGRKYFVFCYILNNSQFLLWYPRWNWLPERWQHDEVHDDDGEDWDGVAGDEETHVEPDEVVVVDVEGANVGVFKEKTCLIKLISNKRSSFLKISAQYILQGYQYKSVGSL